MKTIQTPLMDALLELCADCVSLNALGSVSGAPGTGKTTALKALENRYPTLGLPGKCLYYNCCQASGPSRGVKDILESMGIRKGLIPSGVSLQFLVNLAQRELAQRDIRLMLLDEAHQWATDSLAGIVSLYDNCSRDKPVTFIFAGSADMVKWMAGYSAGLSRTLRSLHFQPLSPEWTLSILVNWLPVFESLKEKIASKDKDATRLIKHIHKETFGNFRKLSFFAQLYSIHVNDESPCFSNVNSTLERINLT